jgi:hypothetical protein
MKNGYPISAEVIKLANMALSRGEHWMAYNQSLYFIDKNEVYFFNSQKEAIEFAKDNFSDRDKFYVFHFNSILDLNKETGYSEKAGKGMTNNSDANGLYNHEGNAFTDALIEHFEHQQLSIYNSQLKTKVMNNENFQFLKDNIKYMGFGENLNAALEKNRSHLKQC